MTHNLMSTRDGSVAPIRSNGGGFAFMRERGIMAATGRSSSLRLPMTNRRAPTIFDALFEQDPTPRFILDGDGRIVEANAEGRGLMARGIVGAGGMLLCSSHRDRARLEEALKRVSQGREATGRVLVRGHDDTWCLIELLGTDELDGHVAATMRRTTELTADRIEPLRAVFGLTPAETQVLMHIVIGKAPKEVARAMSMSIFTVRAHLRAIFMKMGVQGITGTLRLTLQLAL